MRQILLVVLLCACARSSAAQSLTIPDAIFVSAASLDAVTTYHNLSGGATEANPLLATIKSPAGITAAMLSTDALTLWLAHSLRADHHPKLAWTFLLIGAGVHGWCGTHNLGVWAHPTIYAPVPSGFVRN